MKNAVRLLILLSIFLSIKSANAQTGIVTGNLKNTKNNEPIIFAAIGLYERSDSSIYLSTITNDKGSFSITQVKNGNYFLKTSCLGFNEAEIQDILVNSSRPTHDCGTIELEEKTLQLAEIKITAERARGKSKNEGTTYIVKKEMRNSSHSCIELLKYIPGIQIDLKKNIYLEGNSNVIVLINGKERDKNYLSQIIPEEIDRIDVSQGPSSKYRSEAGGVINIILKKNQDQGFGSTINLELPVTYSAAFVNPSATFSYTKNNWSMFLSYTGSFHYFDIDGNKYYDLFSDSEDLEINNKSALKQRNWNHRISLSVDYFLDDKNSLTFYTYYNPSKNEFTGSSSTEILRSDLISGDINYSSKELDHNSANLFSLFYKHKFSKPSTELSIDISHYSFHGDNSFSVWDINQIVTYGNLPSGNADFTIAKEPERCVNYIKLDYTNKLNNKLKLDLGSKYQINYIVDHYSGDFEYSKSDLSAYAMLTRNKNKFTTTFGLRGEYSISKLKSGFNKYQLSILPYYVTTYKLAKNKSLKFSYNRSILRPGLYELNPAIAPIDLYSSMQGNPDLDLGFINKYALEYSSQISSNYFSFQIFYRCIENRIHSIGDISAHNQVLFTPVNIERETEYGAQVSGSLSLFKFLYLIPYFKIYEYDLRENNPLYQSNKSGISYEASLSAIVKLENNFSISLIYQKYGAKYSIQNRTYYDAQYFFSIDKKIGNNIKLGLSTAVPFTSSQSYFENDFNSEKFNLSEKENISISTPILSFKLSYRFNSGKKAKRNKVKNDIQEVRTKKGF